MIRAKLWLTCAAMHDPVSPVLTQPAMIGWDAKYRKVDLTIERGFSGEELLARMKGWVTTDPKDVITAIKEHGRLKILDDRELVVETESEEDFQRLEEVLQTDFGTQVHLEVLKKTG